MFTVKLEILKLDIVRYSIDGSFFTDNPKKEHNFIFDLHAAHALYAALKNNEELCVDLRSNATLSTRENKDRCLYITEFIFTSDISQDGYITYDFSKKQFFNELKKVLSDIFKLSLKTPFMQDLIASGEIIKMIKSKPNHLG